MKRGLIWVFVLLVVVSVAYAEEADYVPGEVIIKFKENPEPSENNGIITTSINSVDELNNKFQVEEMESVLKEEDSKLFKLKVSENEDIDSVIEEYKDDPNVEYAEPNYIRKVFLEPNDEFYSANQWNIPVINATLAWNITKGNDSIVIAIIDTGVDWNHPDLASRIWSNSDETEDGNDNDDNGYIDDIRGYDFVTINDTDSSQCSSGEDCDGIEDNDPMDFHGHGTYCSGIAAADTNNGVGIAGVCWNCSIMPLKAGFKDSSGDGVLADSYISGALHYAADNGANIISMSIGGPNTSTLQDAIDYASSKGVILVAAAGNDGNNNTQYPAAYNNVIAVASTDSDDSRSSFSNFGGWVDIAAPGNNISSTTYDDGYTTSAGTSAAAPHVAGAIALLLSYNSTLTQTEARDVLVNNGNNISNFDGAGSIMPRLNIYLALLSLDTTTPEITFVAPTPANNTDTKNTTIFINITSNEVLDTAILEWNNGTKINQTMNGSGLNWYLNKTDLLNLSYNYTVFGNDSAGNIGFSELRFITVDTSNRAPTVINVTISSTDSLNRTNGTLTGSWAFNDIDGGNQTLNETKWFNNSVQVSGLENLTSISYTNTTKNQNWTFSARVYDGFNWSSWSNATIQIRNTAPSLATIDDITVNESDMVNITANTTDIDNDNINYTINDSRFNQQNNQFIWFTNTSHSGVYHFNITANDTEDIDSQLVIVTVLDAPDFDNDGNPDFNDTDDDNDGIDDDLDYLIGNVSDIDSTIPVKLRINGSENVTQILNGSLKINITDESNNSLIEFDWNFTDSVLDINWTIDYAPENGTIIIRDLEVEKTVYINKSTGNHNYVCITDLDIDNINSMTSGCSAANETKLSCSGSAGGYSCTDLGNSFKVTGLEHSGVKGFYVSPPITITSGNGGGGGSSGGGGGGTITRNPNEASRFFAVLSETFHPLIGINSPNIPVDRLSFNVNKKLYGVRVNIKALDETETPVKIPREVYQYLELSTENLNDSDLSENVEIKFKVIKSWLNQKDVDKNDIALYRYKEKWYKLSTEIEREDNETVFYISKTPGFSIFAIAASKKAEVVKPVEKEEKTEEKITPAITEIEEGKVREEEGGFFVITGRTILGAYKERPLIMISLTLILVVIKYVFIYPRIIRSKYWPFKKKK